MVLDADLSVLIMKGLFLYYVLRHVALYLLAWSLRIIHYVAAPVVCKMMTFSFSCAHVLQGASLVTQTIKNPPAMRETWVHPWAQKTPWRREWQPTPEFWSGEFHGQRSLAGYNSWGRRELEIAEWLPLSLSWAPKVKFINLSWAIFSRRPSQLFSRLGENFI